MRRHLSLLRFPLAVAGFAVAISLASTPAAAQFLPTPVTGAETGQAHLAGPAALFDLSTRFLRVLGNEATRASAGPPLVNNPQGGGASAAETDQRYRAWFEGYGLTSRTSAQGDFAGDS